LISVVVLAAGVSKRYGAQKLEEPYKGKHLLNWTIEVARKVPGRKVMVISRYLDISKFNVEGFEIKVNEHPEKGLSSSVKIAVKECERSDGILLFLGDMPEITSKLVRKVLSFGKKRIVFPHYESIKGFPVFLPSSYFEEALNVDGDVGLRIVIKRHKDECITFKSDRRCVYDVDILSDSKR